jgi:hypothetical protein
MTEAPFECLCGLHWYRSVYGIEICTPLTTIQSDGSLGGEPGEWLYRGIEPTTVKIRDGSSELVHECSGGDGPKLLATS